MEKSTNEHQENQEAQGKEHGAGLLRGLRIFHMG